MAAAARPGLARVGALVRRCLSRAGRAAARAGQQRGSGRAAGADRGRVRAALRRQPPRPLRPDVAAARAAEGERAWRADRERLQRGALRRARRRLRRAPPPHAVVHRDARVRRLQAVQRAVHARARAPVHRAGRDLVRAAPGRGRLRHLAPGAVAGACRDQTADAHRRPGRGHLGVLRHVRGRAGGKRAVLRQVPGAGAQPGRDAGAGRAAVDAQRRMDRAGVIAGCRRLSPVIAARGGPRRAAARTARPGFPTGPRSSPDARPLR